MKRNVLLPFMMGAFLLVGCGGQSLKITKDDVLEVAEDDANVSKDDCSDVSVKKGVDYYTVKFTTDKGNYTYKIGLDGKIQSRSYGKSASGNTTTDDKTSTETKTETKKEQKSSATNLDEKQQAAVDAVLNNMALTEADVTDVQCTLSEDGSQYTVTMANNGTPIQAVVDANTNAVVSTIVG